MLPICVRTERVWPKLSSIQGIRANLVYIQYTLDLRKPDLRKNLDLRKIVGTTDFLVHKLFDLRKIFLRPNFDLRKIFSQKVEKIGTFWQF